MPTGYTATLMEKGQTFKQFAMQAIRAMGVCIEMRDDAWDAPIPEKFEPSDYHNKALKTARADLKKLQNFNNKEKLAYGQEILDRDNEYDTKAIKKAKEENARLDKMIKQVHAWAKNISPEFHGFRDFMLQQLIDSKNNLDYYGRKSKRTPLKVYEDALKSATDSIDYHTEEMKKDNIRYEERNKYLADFRKSLENFK